jgi:hypothetical protein
MPKVISAPLALSFLAAVCTFPSALAAQNSRKLPIEGAQPGQSEQPILSPSENRAAARVYLLELRPPGEMTPEDRALQAGAESAIRQSAELKGLEFRPDQWVYRQLVCPALPQHLLLEFTRDNGAGDVSVFTASIPRASGRVRVVPVQRRGYSLFSPAPENSMTIAVFNRIVAEEGGGLAANRLGIGLCYAALAGVHSRVAAPQGGFENQKFSVAKESVMEVPAQTGAIVRFTDIGNASKPMDWAMTFDGAGKLLKAEHMRERAEVERPVAADAIKPEAVPEPSNGVDLKGNPVPAPALRQHVRPVPQSAIDLPGKPVPPAVLVSRPDPDH